MAFQPRVVAEEPLRLAPGIADPAKPIQFAADSIFTWTENAEQVFLLRGRVLIEQGLLQVRAAQAVLWLDRNRVSLVADGDVQIENGSRPGVIGVRTAAAISGGP